MRRLWGKLILVALILTGVLIILNYEPAVEYDPNEKRFACIVNLGFNYWRQVRDGAFQAGENMGIYVDASNFEFLDVEEQIRLLERAGYMKVDGIMTMGDPDNAKLNETLKNLSDSGISVVLVDTDSPDSGRCCYVGSDNYQIGQTAAQIMAEETGEKGKIMVIVSRLDYANQQERYQGFLDGIATYENMEIVDLLEGESDKEIVQRKLREELERVGEVDAIFCAEGNAGLHIGTVLEEKNLNAENCKVIAMENSESVLRFLEKGIYTGTLYQNGFDMGYKAIENLMDYSEHPEKEAQIVYVDVSYLTKENLSEEEM